MRQRWEVTPEMRKALWDGRTTTWHAEGEDPGAAVSCGLTEDYMLGSPHDFEAQGTGIAALGIEPVVPEELD